MALTDDDREYIRLAMREEISNFVNEWQKICPVRAELRVQWWKVVALVGGSGLLGGAFSRVMAANGF